MKKLIFKLDSYCLSLVSLVSLVSWVSLVSLLSFSFSNLPSAVSSTLSPSLTKDKESIKKMAGCFEITFQNAETFALKKDYAYQDRYKSGGLEWITVDQEKEIGPIALQHLLITPGGILKHWRQVWTYEDKELFDFLPPSIWKKRVLDLKDIPQTWTQKVYQVDDSPRYECSAPWIHYGNTHYWECETEAPLPRREFMKRSDYNILKRKNRHEITMSGHIHDENNIKILKDEFATKSPLVMEKGLNIYKRVDEQRCEEAKNWWQTHQLFWTDVQTVWNEFYGRESLLHFRPLVAGKTLWERLFELDEKYTQATGYSSQAARAESKKTIIEYLIFSH